MKSFALVTLVVLIVVLPALAAEESQRPSIIWPYRWLEDWSVLADPALRTDPFDSIKYMPIGSDPKSYLSLGLTNRERFESVTHQLPPIQPDDYTIYRLQLHADLHLSPYLQVFAQFIDARAPGRKYPTPADVNRLDIEQMFVAVIAPAGSGKLRITGGRQEPLLDLQRFADTRGEGPNVYQPFDSINADYTLSDWRVIGFYSRPVDTRDEQNFDDVSSPHYTLSGARVERRNVGPGKLSVYAAQLRDDNARYVFGSGRERRNVFNLRYPGHAARWDWDVEGMAQGGNVGAKKIRAWGGGGILGYTFTSEPWTPRVGLQIDAASGNRNPRGSTLETFNPLFPSGFYELIAGYPGYANFVHLRALAMARPTGKLSGIVYLGTLWRQTTADAVYQLPAIPVFGTAGHGTRYSGAYGQIRVDYQISPHLTTAVITDYFLHSDSLHAAGARDGHVIGVELRFGI